MTMTARRRALLIGNPHSRTGADRALDTGVALLREYGWAVETLDSTDAGQSAEVVRTRADALDLVIVAGGDGTLHSMLPVLLECELPLAVVPLGTANDLARSLGIPPSVAGAFEAIVANRRRCIDVGRVNGHPFVNAAHLGLGVQVTRELTEDVKKHWGVFSYLKAFVAALARIRQFRVRLRVDGRRRRLRSIQLAVGNGRYYGGGNKVDETACIDDGRLALYSLKPQGVWELLTLAPLLRSGQQRHDRRAYNTTGREIEVRTRPSGMAIHADGEPVTETPARFEILPGALEVVVSDHSEAAIQSEGE